MSTWAGIALALREAGEDALQSRLPTHLHPLAGRVLAWHGLRAAASVDPAPRQLWLVARTALDRTVSAELTVSMLDAARGGWIGPLLERLPDEVDRVLVLDAAAAALEDSTLRHLLNTPGPAVLRTAAGEPLALWAGRDALETAAADAGLADLAADAVVVECPSPEQMVLVRDRATYARALAIVRDRLVRRLMEGGVSFLLPETVLVDVDVAIGRDSIIYPGVVLEGQTTIGAETVVGPGCRIVDAQIGSGVELKGWNYIVGSHIRNRAVLEPYVRRGFD